MVSGPGRSGLSIDSMSAYTRALDGIMELNGKYELALQREHANSERVRKLEGKLWLLIDAIEAEFEDETDEYRLAQEARELLA